MAHMDVLLREDVDNLGHRGDVVRVRAGYGRNYLLPQGLAIEATTGNKRMIEEQRRVLSKREQRERATAEGEAGHLDGLEIRFDRRVGEHGILYGSVTALDIAEALKERGYAVERRRIGLRDHIKEVGDYDVVIKLHRDVTPTIKVRVRKEGAPDELEPIPAEAAEPAPAAASVAPAEESPASVEEDTAEAPGASFVAEAEAESAEE
ncbi:MAG TPA: 50S ribosomal protein L9 [Blastocatellia bacterium]|nr:50S ribosomal protein L9 [Blastocatellia bacterium]